MKISSSSALELSSTNAAAGCLTGALRRLLCRTHHRTNGEEEQEIRPAERQKNPAAPGLIARQMGLDPIPCPPPPGSIGRSRSTNSLETRSGFLSEGPIAGPLMKPSHSFREAPTYLRQENEDFLVLTFAPDDDGDDDERAPSSKRVKPKLGILQSADSVKKTHLSSNPSNRSLVVAEDFSMCATRKEPFLYNGEVESQCNSQNSSPISVLDHSLDMDDAYSISPESRTSEIMNTSLVDLNGGTSTASRDRETSRFLCELTSKRTRADQACRGLSFRIAEDDVRKSNWESSRRIERPEAVGEIAAAVGLEILDSIICETVDMFACCITATWACT